MRPKFILLGFLLLILGGCLTPLERGHRMAGYGQPDEYYIGLAEGCDTGRESVRGWGFVYKDNNTYSSNRFYRSGWDDGHLRCYNDAVEQERKVKESMKEEAIRTYLYEKNRL